MDKMKKTVSKAFYDTIPIMMGYIVLGFGFGILLEDKGYNFVWAFLMALTIYGGSMQYAAVDLLTSGASLVTAAVMTVAINARHFFYGLSMLDKYKDTGKYKTYLMFALTDETYSVACSAYVPEGINKPLYYFLVSLFDQLYWIIGCVAGGLFGSAVSFNSAGVEFSMTALFVVIFTEQWMSTKNHLPAVIGVISSALCLLVFGADNCNSDSYVPFKSAALLDFFGKAQGIKINRVSGKSAAVRRDRDACCVLL